MLIIMLIICQMRYNLSNRLIVTIIVIFPLVRERLNAAFNQSINFIFYLLPSKLLKGRYFRFYRLAFAGQ